VEHYAKYLRSKLEREAAIAEEQARFAVEKARKARARVEELKG
jgi:hypothetical protein